MKEQSLHTGETLADVLQPYREDLVLAVECIFTRYWVADLCNRIGVEFVLGHALYMKAIHGGKVKNDQDFRTQAGSWVRKKGGSSGRSVIKQIVRGTFVP